MDGAVFKNHRTDILVFSLVSYLGVFMKIVQVVRLVSITCVMSSGLAYPRLLPPPVLRLLSQAFKVNPAKVPARSSVNLASEFYTPAQAVDKLLAERMEREAIKAKVQEEEAYDAALAVFRKKRNQK